MTLIMVRLLDFFLIIKFNINLELIINHPL
jgi:hypothetical protein